MLVGALSRGMAETVIVYFLETLLGLTPRFDRRFSNTSRMALAPLLNTKQLGKLPVLQLAGLSMSPWWHAAKSKH